MMEYLWLRLVTHHVSAWAKRITCTHQFCPYSMESVNTPLLQMTSWKEKIKLSQGAAEPERSTSEPTAPPLPSSLPLSLAGAVEATLPAEGEGQAACQGHRKERQLCAGHPGTEQQPAPNPHISVPHAPTPSRAPAMTTTGWQLHLFKTPQLRVDCRPGTCLESSNPGYGRSSVYNQKKKNTEAFSIILKLVHGAPESSPEILCHRDHV